MSKEVALFEKSEVRRIWHEDQWWFVIVDIIAILSESVNPAEYFKKLRKRDIELSKLYLKGGGQIVPPLGLEFITAGGKQKLICWNNEGILRLIQSVPSPNAEPFKRWLARVGKERIDEINDPELAMERMRQLYRKKGYPKDWIDKRMRGIAVRQDLTEEWQNRGAKQSIEFAILTNEIMKGAFDMKVDEYKNLKGLDKENLRDHMNDIELILTMLAEATTTKIHRDRNSKGLPKLKKDAKDGGAVAGRTRKDIEKTSGRKVIDKKNYLSNNRTKRRK